MAEQVGISPDLRLYFEEIPKGETYLEEAEFGLRRVAPHLDGLASGARVLEVGSGPCILLAEMSRRRPDITFQGIEPMSHGFAFFDSFVSRLKEAQPGLNIHLGGYESFDQPGQWDLIFLVNVFEHLPDWQDFLRFVAARLAPGGRCIVLCPNYGFPYESHFALPVVVNKRITRAVFSRRIARVEQDGDLEGLYHSLNFVRLSQVRRAVRQTGLTLEVRTDIIGEMINRLDTDPAFAERQKLLAVPARILRRTGLLGLALRSRMIQNVLPYMELVLTR